MKVTTKGQVTIPIEVRERLGIYPGAEVEFTIEGRAAKLTPIRRTTKAAKRLVQRLQGRATLGMTTDEILALTRGEED